MLGASARPAGVAAADAPLPGRALGGGELVVVAAGEGLERDQVRVVAEEDLGAGGGVDLGLAGATDDAFPADGRAVEPVDDFDQALAATPVDQLGEGGGAAPRGGQVGAGGDGAAFAAAVAEVDRDEGEAGGPGHGERGRGEGAGEAGERPAVGGNQGVMATGIGKPRRTGEAPGDRTGEAATGVDFASRGHGGDRGQSQERDQSDQAGLLDAGRAALAFPERSHAREARRERRTGGAQAVTTLPRNRRLLFMCPMEGSPFNLFGDPDEFRARMEELSEQMQSSQRVAWADNAIKLAVEMTVASIAQLDLSGSPDEQSMQVRDAIRVLFPEAVTLVREAREGLS